MKARVIRGHDGIFLMCRSNQDLEGMGSSTARVNGRRPTTRDHSLGQRWLATTSGGHSPGRYVPARKTSPPSGRTRCSLALRPASGTWTFSQPEKQIASVLSRGSTKPIGAACAPRPFDRFDRAVWGFDSRPGVRARSPRSFAKLCRFSLPQSFKTLGLIGD
eukprot:6650750-Prymnesium_polylepis.1